MPFGKNSQGAIKEPWVVPHATGRAREASALISSDCTLVGKLLLKRTEQSAFGQGPSPLEGSLQGAVQIEAVQIEGVIEGEIIAEKDLLIGESARVTAKISGTSVRVLGTVTGDISCSERLEILSGAHVRGNIEAPVVVINDGATFEGRCSMRTVAGSSSLLTSTAVRASNFAGNSAANS